MIFHDGKNQVTLDFPQDPDAKQLYTIYLRPDIWAADTPYITNKHLVIPSVFNGFYYVAQSGGISGSTEPLWPCKQNETVVDNCVVWRAVPYDLSIDHTDSIVTATWTADDPSVIFLNQSDFGNGSKVIIGNLPAVNTQVTINVHFVLTSTVEVDISFIIPIKQL